MLHTRLTGADDGPQVLDRTGSRPAKDCFEFGEELLDRIEVRTVTGREESLCARQDSLANARNLVNADVVHDDDVAGLGSWSKEPFDVGQEALAIHHSIQQQGAVTRVWRGTAMKVDVFRAFRERSDVPCLGMHWFHR